jgi:hypothetical protein
MIVRFTIMTANLSKNLVFCCLFYKTSVNLQHDIKQTYPSPSFAIQGVSWGVGMYLLYSTKGLTNIVSPFNF